MVCEWLDSNDSVQETGCMSVSAAGFVLFLQSAADTALQMLFQPECPEYNDRNSGEGTQCLEDIR